MTLMGDMSLNLSSSSSFHIVVLTLKDPSKFYSRGHTVLFFLIFIENTYAIYGRQLT